MNGHSKYPRQFKQVLTRTIENQTKKYFIILTKYTRQLTCSILAIYNLKQIKQHDGYQSIP